jgi:hypothetical protein
MHRIGTALATTFSLLALGCAATPAATATHTPATAATAVAETKADTATQGAVATDEALAAADSDASTPTTTTARTTAATPAARTAGDYVVYRFTGSFRDRAATLTQRVLSRTGDNVLVAMTLDDGHTTETIEATVADGAANRGEVLAVTRLEGERRVEGSLEDYDALLAKVTLAADQNEALLGTETRSVEISGTSIPCRTVTFRVKVGKREAVLETTESDTFAWGDVRGELRTPQGQLLYRAEVVELGTMAPKSETVAHVEVDDADE